MTSPSTVITALASVSAPLPVAVTTAVGPPMFRLPWIVMDFVCPPLTFVSRHWRLFVLSTVTSPPITLPSAKFGPPFAPDVVPFQTR